MENEDCVLIESSSLRQCSKKLSPPDNLIPGPAGAVQFAMLKRRSTRRSPECGEDDNPVVFAQECIRRAIEGNGRGNVDDFHRHPWLSAVHFLDGETCTPISDLRFLVDKVPRTVAIVNSSALNADGDMMATLQDPTGAVKASIHRSVFSDEGFKKKISVGSVLVLKEVAVFSPSPSVRYLNITHKNVIAIFPKDAIDAPDEVIPVETSHVPCSSLSLRRDKGIEKNISNCKDDGIVETGAKDDIGGETVHVACDSSMSVSAECSTSSVKALLPEWTDEQLDLLFAFD